MSDLPVRAKRAGATVKTVAKPAAAAPYDLVLTDVPCSGSGSWRRDPQGKWALTGERLAELTRVQSTILREAAALVKAGGVLGYATCSLLDAENGGQIREFLAEQTGWTLQAERRFTPLDGGDGFYGAVLRKG